MTRLLTILALIVLFAWLLGRALDQEAASAIKGNNSLLVRSSSPGVLEEGEPQVSYPSAPGAHLAGGGPPRQPASPSSSTSAGLSGRAAAVSAPQSARSENLVQGRNVNWWARRAIQNGTNSRARGRTIRRLQTAARRKLTYPTGHWLDGAFLCISRHERGAAGWRTLTGNGYHGGLQMDAGFQRTYGPEWARQAFGESAHLWPASVQITAAIRAWTTRGFGPWPSTRRMCGL